MWCRVSTLTMAALILVVSKSTQGKDWIDYGEPASNVDTAFDDDSDQYVSALTRDQEQEIHSPFITGYKYVSGNLIIQKIDKFDCIFYIQVEQVKVNNILVLVEKYQIILKLNPMKNCHPIAIHLIHVH